MPTCPKGHESVATDYCDECGSPIGGTAVAPGGAAPQVGTVAATGVPAEDCPSCGATRTGRFCEVCGHDFVLGDPAPEAGPNTPAGAAAPAQAPPLAEVPPAEAPPAETPPPQEATGGPDGVAVPPDGAQPAGEAGVPPVVPVGDAGALAGNGSQDAVLAPDLPRRAGPVTGWRVVAAADRDYHERMQAIAMPDAPPIPFPQFCPERRFSLRPGQVLIGRRRPSRGIEPDIDLTGPPEDAAVSHAHAMLVSDAGGGWSIVDLDSANGTYLNEAPEALHPHVPVPLSDGDRIHVGAWTTLTVVHEAGGSGAA